MVTRREFLRLGAAASGALALEPCAAAGLGDGKNGRDGSALLKGEDDFHFVVVNDLHYRDAQCAPWFERVTASIRNLRPRPAFVMLAGDLSESGLSEQLGAVHEIFRVLPMPVHSVVGNHDCTEQGDFSVYRSIYGPVFNYQFHCGDWQFLAFDSTQGPEVFWTKISNDSLAWLDQVKPSLSRERPLVLLTHFPLGRNWLRPRNARLVMERLRGYNVQATLGGHWHGITEFAERGIHLSTNRCCSWWRTNHDGSPLKGYALCRVRGGKLTHEFQAVV